MSVNRVASQSSKRIEQLAPELEKILSPSESIHDLADGFGGPLGPAEGPLWWKEGRYLLFSDIHNDKRMKYVPGQGVTVFQQPTNRANGLTRDLQGRLIACEHDSRRVTRQELDGSITVDREQLPGAAAQPSQRRRGQIGRLHLLHGSVDQSRGPRAVGPHRSPACTASRPIWAP